MVRGGGSELEQRQKRDRGRLLDINNLFMLHKKKSFKSKSFKNDWLEAKIVSFFRFHQITSCLSMRTYDKS